MANEFEKIHLLSIMRNVYKFLAQQTMCDLSIYIENSCFHLHRCIFAAACPLLHYLILQSMENSKDNSLSLVLHGIKSNGFKAVLKYIYSGKVPKDSTSETWNDFVETCEYLSLPYPVSKRKKISLHQPTEEVHVTLTPHTNGSIGVVLKKNSDAPSDKEVDVPVELVDHQNELETSSSTGYVESDDSDHKMDGSKVLLRISGHPENTDLAVPIQCKEDVRNPVRKSSKPDLHCESALSQQNTNKQLKGGINCCGRFLIETSRENVTTCAKITYICTSCKSKFVAVGEGRPQKVTKETQTPWSMSKSGPESGLGDEYKYLEGSKVEVCILGSDGDAETLLIQQDDSGMESQSQDTFATLSHVQGDMVEISSMTEEIVESRYVPHSRNKDLRTCAKRTKVHESHVTCLSCHKILSSKSGFELHVQRFHPGERVGMEPVQRKRKNEKTYKFSCKSCNAGYNVQKRLTAHETECANRRKFKCTHCPLRFPRCDGWERHLLEVHNVQV